MDINEALELIHQYCPVGGFVMDLFAGTMVTALAALRLNRRCVCVEVDKALVPAATTRLHKWYRWLMTHALLINCGNQTVDLSCAYLMSMY